MQNFRQCGTHDRALEAGPLTVTTMCPSCFCFSFRHPAKADSLLSSLQQSCCTVCLTPAFQRLPAPHHVCWWPFQVRLPGRGSAIHRLQRVRPSPTSQPQVPTAVAKEAESREQSLALPKEIVGTGEIQGAFGSCPDRGREPATPQCVVWHTPSDSILPYLSLPRGNFSLCVWCSF